ncbi:uncharacterized protein LOC111089047 [Limulus polyphemus]|uniref:Uncharacterized protein LOC111089047 n=1 Tax=Limulus polyphemus TaxID=6850 RepID=A0ABM1TKM6_LIMPO|nr:uncharacterized protein LOC111089047 [Limulus polyphemus]
MFTNQKKCSEALLESPITVFSIVPLKEETAKLFLTDVYHSAAVQGRTSVEDGLLVEDCTSGLLEQTCTTSLLSTYHTNYHTVSMVQAEEFVNCFHSPIKILLPIHVTSYNVDQKTEEVCDFSTVTSKPQELNLKTLLQSFSSMVETQYLFSNSRVIQHAEDQYQHCCKPQYSKPAISPRVLFVEPEFQIAIVSESIQKENHYLVHKTFVQRAVKISSSNYGQDGCPLSIIEGQRGTCVDVLKRFAYPTIFVSQDLNIANKEVYKVSNTDEKSNSLDYNQNPDFLTSSPDRIVHELDFGAMNEAPDVGEITHEMDFGVVNEAPYIGEITHVLDFGAVNEAPDVGEIVHELDFGAVIEAPYIGEITHVLDFGAMNEAPDVGEIKQELDFGAMNEAPDVGEITHELDFGAVNEAPDVGETKQELDFGAMNEAPDVGEITHELDFGAVNEAPDFGEIKQELDFGAVNEAPYFGEIKQELDFSAVKQPSNINHITEELDFGEITRELDFGAVNKAPDIDHIAQELDFGAVNKATDDDQMIREFDFGEVMLDRFLPEMNQLPSGFCTSLRNLNLQGKKNTLKANRSVHDDCPSETQIGTLCTTEMNVSSSDVLNKQTGEMVYGDPDNSARMSRNTDFDDTLKFYFITKSSPVVSCSKTSLPARINKNKPGIKTDILRSPSHQLYTFEEKETKFGTRESSCQFSKPFQGVSKLTSSTIRQMSPSTPTGKLSLQFVSSNLRSKTLPIFALQQLTVSSSQALSTKFSHVIDQASTLTPTPIAHSSQVTVCPPGKPSDTDTSVKELSEVTSTLVQHDSLLDSTSLKTSSHISSTVGGKICYAVLKHKGQISRGTPSFIVQTPSCSSYTNTGKRTHSNIQARNQLSEVMPIQRSRDPNSSNNRNSVPRNIFSASVDSGLNKDFHVCSEDQEYCTTIGSSLHPNYRSTPTLVLSHGESCMEYSSNWENSGELHLPQLGGKTFGEVILTLYMRDYCERLSRSAPSLMISCSCFKPLSPCPWNTPPIALHFGNRQFWNFRPSSSSLRASNLPYSHISLAETDFSDLDYADSTTLKSSDLPVTQYPLTEVESSHSNDADVTASTSLRSSHLATSQNPLAETEFSDLGSNNNAFNKIRTTFETESKTSEISDFVAINDTKIKRTQKEKNAEKFRATLTSSIQGIVGSLGSSVDLRKEFSKSTMNVTLAANDEATLSSSTPNIDKKNDDDPILTLYIRGLPSTMCHTTNSLGSYEQNKFGLRRRNLVSDYTQWKYIHSMKGIYKPLMSTSSSWEAGDLLEQEPKELCLGSSSWSIRDQKSSLPTLSLKDSPYTQRPSSLPSFSSVIGGVKHDPKSPLPTSSFTGRDHYDSPSLALEILKIKEK